MNMQNQPLKGQSRAQVLWMVQTAILMAIVILMAFTPLGYLKVGIISITFLTIPVAVGAILVGPLSGLILGAVFGLTSFAQALLGDPFGVALLAINPYLTFILCMVPRILMGWLVGLIFKGLAKVDKTKTWSFAVASLSSAALNSIFFLSALVVFFGKTDFLHMYGPTIPTILGVIATVNVIVEAVACMIAGTAIVKILSIALGRWKARSDHD
jgi:uncharacterized membrane protein